MEETEEMKKNIKLMFANITSYCECENIHRNKFGTLATLKKSEPPKYFSLTKAIVCVLLIGALWAFVNPKTNFSYDSLGLQSITETANVYKRPDTNSKVIGKVHSATIRKTLRVTDNFLKIKYTDSTGKKITGFVIKTQLKTQ